MPQRHQYPFGDLFDHGGQRAVERDGDGGAHALGIDFAAVTPRGLGRRRRLFNLAGQRFLGGEFGGHVVGKQTAGKAGGISASEIESLRALGYVE